MEKYLTNEGLKKLKKELEYLKRVKRKEIAARLERAVAFEDLSENSEYLEAKEAQGFLEGRILELEDLISRAVVIPEEKNTGFVQIGSTILVDAGRQKEKFKIVGAEEANPLEGKISDSSPLGKALLNQPKGAVVEICTPQGRIRYKIIKIE
jgi:transcription elongation factor GreA